MNNKLKNTITKLAPAVFTSLVATSIGLLSLFQSRVPMIQDFGMMLAIGIAVAFVLAILVLLPILVNRDKLIENNDIIKSENKSIYRTVLKSVSRFIYRMKYGILVVAVLLAGIGFFVDQQVGVETNFERFMPQDSEALQDIQQLRSIVGSTERVVLLYRSDDVTSFQTINEVDILTNTIKTKYNENIENIASMSLLLNQVSSNSWDSNNMDMFLSKMPESQVRLLQDTDSNQGAINLALKQMNDEEFTDFVNDLEKTIQDLDLNIAVSVTGQSIVDQEMLQAMTGDRLSMTMLGIGLVFVTLLILYRNLFKALVVILPIILIVGWSGGIMYLFGYDYTPLTSTLGALIIGIGTEFTILIMMRFYDFKKEGQSLQESIENAVSYMGKPIIVSAITTIGGFSALIFSDFEILSNFGIMTVVNLSLALISALFVLPALLGVIGKQAKEFSTK